MKILLLAPHPFFQDRGTPIAVDLLLRALVDLGHQVDVLTYHLGEARSYERVRIFRIPQVPGIQTIRPGFSAKKLVCDLFMLPLLVRRLNAEAYDVVHAVEESVFLAHPFCKSRGIPLIFDMDSSMPEQMAHKQKLFRPLLPWLEQRERRAMRDAAAVAAVCDALADKARAAGATKVEVLNDISLLEVYSDAQQKLELPPHDHRTFLYVGNLEPYQGIDLLLRAFADVCCRRPDARLLVVGGRSDDIAACRQKAVALSIGSSVCFAGPRPVAALPQILQYGTFLVSPRTQGNNTPMKIYSYLDSGRPVLATDLPTHTQVLTPEIAMLAPANPGAFAKAMIALLDDPAAAQQRAQAARERVRERYSYAGFREKVSRLYRSLPGATAQATHAAAAAASPTDGTHR